MIEIIKVKDKDFLEVHDKESGEYFGRVVKNNGNYLFSPVFHTSLLVKQLTEIAEKMSELIMDDAA